jgi:hypothetical protein
MTHNMRIPNSLFPLFCRFDPMIRIENVSKSFTLHNQGAVEIPVMDRASLDVAPG